MNWFKKLFHFLFPCRYSEPLCEDNLFGCRCGKGGVTVQQPSPPPQPSTADAITAWVGSLPQVYQTQLQYEPQLMQQQLDLAQQYAPQFTQTMYDISQQLYPETVGLQENLAAKAAAGMEEGVPEAVKQQYLSDMSALMGTNVGSGIAADYMSRGLMQQQEDWQKYYQNLALTTSGKQPLQQPIQPQGTGWTQGFTPQTAMGFMQGTYSPYAGAYGQMYSANAQLAAQQPNMMNYLGAAGGMMSGLGMTGI